MSLTEWKEISETAEALATVAAIVVGGIWTYLSFFRERIGQTKIETKLGLAAFRLNENSRLLHATVYISNLGKVRFSSSEAELRLRQVIPAPQTIAPQIRSNIDPVEVGRTEIDWPVLAQRKWEWKAGAFEIEPGEGDALHADFGVQADVQVVELYFYMRNDRKNRGGVGWTTTEVFRIEEAEETVKPSGSRHDDLKADRPQKQQRPQPAQQQQQQQQ